MKNKKAVIVIVAAVVIFVIVLAFFAIKGLVENNSKPAGEGNYRLLLMDEQVAAPDIQFIDLDDKVHKLSDFRGKTVIVNFWAIFCPPCIEELPDFNKAAAELDKYNAVIIALNVTEGKNDIKDFIDKMNLDQLDFYIDFDGNGSQTYGVDTIPRTIVIDEKGYVRSAARGAVTYEDLIHIADILD